MEKRAAQTAQGPMVIVAVEQNDEHPLHHDELAYRIVPTSMKLFVNLTRWRPLRRLMMSGLEKGMPGGWASFLCRKRYVEDKLLEATKTGIDAVVILGAGFDTLAYRLPILAKTPVYEVDLPENIELKRTSLHKLHGKVPDHVTLVPVDFQTQNLEEVLTGHGYRRDQQTFFVWEAVTQYLTEDAVRKTFDFLAGASTGSRLAFTYVRRDFLDGVAFYGAESLHRDVVVKNRLWHFGMNPGQVADFLAEYGWNEVEQVGPREFTDRYVRPSGRGLRGSEVERSVYAEKA